jgi:hypothetical protein
MLLRNTAERTAQIHMNNGAPANTIPNDAIAVMRPRNPSALSC